MSSSGWATAPVGVAIADAFGAASVDCATVDSVGSLVTESFAGLGVGVATLSVVAVLKNKNEIYLLTYMRVLGFGQKTLPSQDGCINHCNVGFP